MQMGIDMNRRHLLLTAAFALVPAPAFAAKKKKRRAPLREPYYGSQVVYFDTPEKPGTVIISTGRRKLYYVLGDGEAIEYGVAVGKEGFDWAGVARVGLKREWPTWTPPAAMIRRRPELAKWRNGMPGGDENPLGSRAIYLFTKKGDTGFRIHGTIEPESIGTAASSGCIRMLNEEVEELYEAVRIGTKVIVL
jgi:lipoprotein-anchoring transpeptidase ErfK/SrfK